MANKTYVLLIFIIILGAFLRFYKLDWGSGLFTHPDEYHIVASVAQLSFPTQMHPHFFSYGTVTIYLIYFTQELLKFFLSIPNSQFLIPNSFLLGRFYSALFSTLTILIVYKICRHFLKKHFSLLAALLVAITPGLIQQAHFATPEPTLTFFLFGSLLLLIKFAKDSKIFYLIIASIFLGFALGVKVSSIVFLLPLVITIGIQFFRQSLRLKEKILRLIEQLFVSAVTIFTTFFLVDPYVFLDTRGLQSTLDYEGGLAVGKIPVFYTRQFIDTTPVLFQIEKILPYALVPTLLVFGIFGLFLMAYKHLGWWQADPERSRRRSHDSSEVDSRIMLLIVIAFLSLFIPNAFLFAKWTRFIAPTFPFFAIFAAFFLDKLYTKNSFLSNFLTIALLTTTFLWTTAFFSIYLHPDVRITASNWIERNFPENSTILIEGGNMIDVPLQGNFKRIGFDFYNLETDTETRSKIADGLKEADYFLVQSRRVFMNHQRLPKLYPKTTSFYNTLFNGGLGFEQIKEFHSYPKLGVGSWELEVADEAAEETWSVFDHPVIRVFKKNKQLSQDQYRYIVDGGKL